jgi:hypothetical protein
VLLLATAAAHHCARTTAFLLPPTRSRSLVVLRSGSNRNNKDWEQEIDEKSMHRAKSGGAGETVAGAVLGGLLGGPFGALFGASIGSNIGARSAVDRARKDEMERLGLDQQMLDAAQDIGLALERSNEGLQASQESLVTLQRFAKLLDAEAVALYGKAIAALQESNEDRARMLLLERTEIQEKLKKTLLDCAAEKKRLEKMEENVSQLERRAMEIDALLRRSVTSKTIQDSNQLGLSFEMDDPLLRKFKDLGID